MTTFANIANLINARPYMMQRTERAVTAIEIENAVTDYDGLCVKKTEQDAWLESASDMEIALWAEGFIIDQRQCAMAE